MSDIYRMGWANAYGWLFERTDWRTFEIPNDGSTPGLSTTCPFHEPVFSSIAGYVNSVFSNINWDNTTKPEVKERFINDCEFLFPKGWAADFWKTMLSPDYDDLKNIEDIAGEYLPSDVSDEAYSEIHVYQFGTTGHIVERFEEREMPGTNQKKYEVGYRTIYDKRPYADPMREPIRTTEASIFIVPERIANIFDGFYTDIKSDGIEQVYDALFDAAGGLCKRVTLDYNCVNICTLYDMEITAAKIFGTARDYFTAGGYIGDHRFQLVYKDPDSTIEDEPAPEVTNLFPSKYMPHPETVKAMYDVILEKVNRKPYDPSAKWYNVPH